MIYLEALAIYVVIGCILSICWIVREFVRAGTKGVVTNRVLMADVEWSFVYALAVVAIVALARFSWVIRQMS